MIDTAMKDATDLGPDPLAEPPKPMAQRGERGWFLRGNSVSKCTKSPHASKVVALRSALFREVTPERWARIIRAMIVEAVGQYDSIEGKWVARPNVKAAEWISDRLIGKPIESGADDRLKRIEESLGLDESLDPAHVADMLATAQREGDDGPETVEVAP